MKIKQSLWMTASIPILVAGLGYLIFAIYSYFVFLFDIQTGNPDTGAFWWPIIFSFGFISIATIFAAKAKFLERQNIRHFYLYATVVSAVLFGSLSIYISAVSFFS